MEVVNMAFAEIEVIEPIEDATLFGFHKKDILDFAEVGLLAIMGILVVLLVLRPLVGQLISAQIESLEDQAEQALLSSQMNSPALAAPTGTPGGQAGAGGVSPMAPVEEEDTLIDMQAVEGRVKKSTARKVGDIVTNHPNETVSVLRNWMSQE